MLYIPHWRGLRIASFDKSGQCEGLLMWNWAMMKFHALFYVVPYIHYYLRPTLEL